MISRERRWRRFLASRLQEAARERVATLLFCLIAFLVLAGCEKPTHDNIDKWRNTEKGPGKLVDALKNRSLDADLRAHAAQALVSIDRLDDVAKVLGAAADDERAAVLGKLAPRLWNDAKINDELQVPTSRQVAAKDALFALRDLAPADVKATIDGYLVDWLTGYYEGRAGLGLHRGEKIVRALGPRTAPKLVEAARKAANAPPEGNKFAPVSDELLRGLAFTGAPEAVGLLLELLEKDEPDETLPVRTIAALREAYATDGAPVGGEAVRPHIATLVRLASDPRVPGEVANVAFDLLVATGMPHCLEPLAGLAAHKDEVRRWQAVQKGLACGGTAAVVALTEALPTGESYPVGIIDKYFWRKVVERGSGAAEPARTLLGSRSWVARMTGAALLAELGTPEDVARLRRLQSDKTRARGYYKDDDGQKKPDPTVGGLAADAANKLEKRQEARVK